MDKFVNRTRKVISLIEKNSLLISLSFFGLGILVTAWLPSLGKGVGISVDYLLGVYGYIVALLLYFLLTPSIIKVISLSQQYGNGWLKFVLKQFTVARFVACLFAIFSLTIIFGLTIYINGTTTFGLAARNVFGQLIHTLFFSPYLYGLYAAIITVTISQKSDKIKHIFEKIGDSIENAGEYFTLLAPFFMFAIGSFLYYLPTAIERSLTDQSVQIQTIVQNLNLDLWNLNILPQEFLFVGLYIYISILVALLCLSWHAGYCLYIKFITPSFKLGDYIKRYWIKVYPLLWSTSSETLAVPLSLNLLKRYYPSIPSQIRQFTVTVGSYLGINGTVICVYVVAVFLAVLLGVQISLLQLLFSIPIVFILGYAVPGIPGELLIFAGPMAVLLGVSPEAAPFFLALYITLQIGLPDAFRTGTNSTDNALVAISTQHKLKDFQKQHQRDVYHREKASFTSAPTVSHHSIELLPKPNAIVKTTADNT